jgi:hypothetical protein
MASWLGFWMLVRILQVHGALGFCSCMLNLVRPSGSLLSTFNLKLSLTGKAAFSAGLNKFLMPHPQYLEVPVTGESPHQ